MRQVYMFKVWYKTLIKTGAIIWMTFGRDDSRIGERLGKRLSSTEADQEHDTSKEVEIISKLLLLTSEKYNAVL